MPKHPVWKATPYAFKTAEKAISGLGRWATTDHTGTAKLLAELPPMGWMADACFPGRGELNKLLGAIPDLTAFAGRGVGDFCVSEVNFRSWGR